MRRTGLAALAALVAGLAAMPAQADVKGGVEAWSRGEYAAAVRQWEGPAAKGDADAQFNLAQAWKLGKGVPRVDLAKAEALYRKAADQGHLQAADTYGLLLFQSGRREEAMAWIVPSAERGEPRAQYVLGIAHFNGDFAAKDPVRAYALMTRAAAAGLDQAKASLATMDAALPLDQRQQAMILAAELEVRADAARATQLAAADLGAKPGAVPRRVVGAAPAPARLKPEPVTAGADFAHPATLGKPAPAPAEVAPRPAQVLAAPATARAAPAPAPAVAGAWRVQLGAFAVAGSAEALWARLKSRPALAGAQRFLVPGGHLTRLQAGPFASREAATAACAALAGHACLAIAP